MLSEQIKRTTVSLHCNNGFIGSGVIFVRGTVVYVVTAGHNIYGSKRDKPFTNADWLVEDYSGTLHPVESIDDNEDFSKTYDIALLKIRFMSDPAVLPTVHFAPRPHLSSTEFFFRGKYGVKKEPVSKGVVHFQENYKDDPYRFLGSINKEQLINSIYLTGNDWLKGCSGSGLFLHHNTEIICCGVLLEIPDKGDNGQLLFCSLNALSGFNLNFSALPATIYDHNNSLLSSRWFEDKITESIDSLGKRYTPNTNFKLPIFEIGESFSRSAVFKRKMDTTVGAIFKARRSVYHALGHSFTTEYRTKIDEFLECFRAFYLSSEFEGFKSIDFEQLIEISTAVQGLLKECVEKLYVEQRNKELEAPTPRHATRPFQADIHELRALSSALENCDRDMSNVTSQIANNPFLIVKGEAGCGKSHFLGDICNKRSKQGLLSVLLFGHHFSGYRPPWSQVIRDQLNLSMTEDEFLNELDLRAHLTGNRVLIVIDAINEGEGRKLWEERVKSFIAKIRRYDGLGLIISVRTSYHDLLIDKSVYEEKLALSITHWGFSEFEYEASDYFFDNYGLSKPSIPLLHPEFRNPLFLKLFCDGLSNLGYTEIPSGVEGITTIFSFFLKSVNKKLAEELEFGSGLEIVNASVEVLAKEMLAKRSTDVKYQEAVAILATTDEACLIDRRSLLASRLIEEGVFAKNLFYDQDGKPYEGIFFQFERLLDHSQATLSLKELGPDPKLAFEKGGEFYDYFKDSNACRRNFGLLEALSIQIPEKYGIEFFEFVPHVRNDQEIYRALISSLVWRRDQEINQHAALIKSYLLEVRSEEESFSYLLEELLLISGVPNHPFNAQFLHDHLIGISMPERDGTFSYWLAENYSESSSKVQRLIDWAWKNQYRREIADESVFLSAITLSWFLVSPDRNIRDGATKAMVSLLQNREHLLAALLSKFQGVDDPYVSERLLGVAYGCSLRAQNFDFLAQLCREVFSAVFDKASVNPHVLLRDYAAGIIRLGISKSIPLDFDIQRCLPPYSSESFTTFPSNEEIDSRYQLDDQAGEFYYYQNEIIDSMTTEYGRGLQAYGDFGRYVFGSALTDWEVDHGEMSNLAIQRVFELGYKIEIHGQYDRYYASGEGRERIGKKYQWIAFHEIVGRISDHFPMKSDQDRTLTTPYRGPWQPGIRDIDVSVTVRGLAQEGSLDGDEQCWWSKYESLNLTIPNKDWMSLTDDIPEDRTQIFIVDENGTEWVCLHVRSYKLEELSPLEDDYKAPYKKYYKHVTAFFTSRQEISVIKAWAPNRSNEHLQQIPEPSHSTQVYNREYYWAEPYSQAQEPFYGGNGDDSIREGYYWHDVAEVHLPTQYLLLEKGNDYSIDGAFSFYKPTLKLVESLGLVDLSEEGKLADEFGKLACFDPSVAKRGPSCLLLRKDLFFRFLAKEDLEVFWLVDGEKQILASDYSDDERNPTSRHYIRGFYYLDSGELIGDSSSTIEATPRR